MGTQSSTDMLAQWLMLLVIAHAAPIAASSIQCGSFCQATPDPTQCTLVCHQLQEFSARCGFASPIDDLRALAASTDPLGYASTILSDLLNRHSLAPGAGSYDLCQAIPSASYCLSRLQLSLSGKLQPLTTMSTCVSSSCTSTTVSGLWSRAIALAQMTASNASSNASRLPLSVETDCGDHSYDWEMGSYIWLSITGALVLTTLVCTAVSLTTENLAARQLSLVNHWIGFVTPRPTKIKTGCMDGIRWMSMCWVVMGHTLLWPIILTVGYSNMADILPAHNSAERETHDALSGRWTGQAIQSAEFSVDSFFFMSGFLAVYIGLKKLGSQSWLRILLQAPYMILDRFLRLTPTYMLVLFAIIYIVPLASHGPYWHAATQPGVDACKANWWHNLFYIQSILSAIGTEQSMCFNVSWYLADDMVFFCFIPPLIALAVWKRSVSYLSMIVLWCISVVAAGFTSHSEQWSVSLFDASTYGQKYYFPPWFRIPPYLIGTAFGLFWTDHGKLVSERVQSSKPLQMVLWAVTVFLLLVSFYGITAGTATSPSSTSRVATDVYIALSKSAWTVGVMTLCVLCFTGCGGLANWFLAHPAMGVMGKLTYCTYLLHVPFMQIVYGSRVSAVHFSTFEYSHAFVGFLGLAAASALVLHLFVEVPTSKLIDLLLPHRKTKPAAKLDHGDSECYVHQINKESEKNELNQNLIV